MPRDAGANTLFTIGHSNHPIGKFVGLLLQHEIAVLADVRSIPASRFNPHFNRKALDTTLAGNGIRYWYLGDSLGGRGGHTAQSESFQKGLAQLLEEARQHRTAIMCAEKKPADCHRTKLIAPEVERAGMAVVHILADGSLEQNPHIPGFIF